MQRAAGAVATIKWPCSRQRYRAGEDSHGHVGALGPGRVVHRLEKGLADSCKHIRQNEIAQHDVATHPHRVVKKRGDSTYQGSCTKGHAESRY